MSLVETLPSPETETWCASGVVGDGEGGSTPGDIDPTGGDVPNGWPKTETPPRRQRWNWVFNMLHRMVRYFKQRGLPEYNADETYPQYAYIQYGNRTFMCNVSCKGQTPNVSADTTYWKRWGHTEAIMVDSINNLSAALITALAGSRSSGITGTNGATVSDIRYFAINGVIMTTFKVTGVSYSTQYTALTFASAAAFPTSARTVQATLHDTLVSATSSIGASIVSANVVGLQFNGLSDGFDGTAFVTVIGD